MKPIIKLPYKIESYGETGYLIITGVGLHMGPSNHFLLHPKDVESLAKDLMSTITKPVRDNEHRPKTRQASST